MHRFYLPPEHCLYPQDICQSMRIDRSLGIEDLRHVPMNALIMFGWLPIIRPECGLQILSPSCPILQPDQIGMSIFLTSPAYLLAIPAVLRGWRQRIVIGSLLSILLIAILNFQPFIQRRALNWRSRSLRVRWWLTSSCHLYPLQIL